MLKFVALKALPLTIILIAVSTPKAVAEDDAIVTGGQTCYCYKGIIEGNKCRIVKTIVAADDVVSYALCSSLRKVYNACEARNEDVTSAIAMRKCRRRIP